MEASARYPLITPRYQVQQLADREASRWVDEMAATRARDASLLSDELAEWVAKSKRLQAEVDELTKTFDTQLEARTVELRRTCEREREAALEAVAVERAAFDAYRKQAKSTLEHEKLQMLQRSWTLASHAVQGGAMGRRSMGGLPHARSEPASPPTLQSASVELRRSPSVSHAMLDPACATGAGAPPPRLGETPLPQRDKSSPPSLPRDCLPPLAPPPVTSCGKNTWCLTYE